MRKWRRRRWGRACVCSKFLTLHLFGSPHKLRVRSCVEGSGETRKYSLHAPLRALFQVRSHAFPMHTLVCSLSQSRAAFMPIMYDGDRTITEQWLISCDVRVVVLHGSYCRIRSVSRWGLKLQYPDAKTEVATEVSSRSLKPNKNPEPVVVWQIVAELHAPQIQSCTLRSALTFS